MNILGISGGIRQGNQDGAAALLVDGELVAAVEEERLTRIKHAPGLLPEKAVKFCLKRAGLRIEDVDLLVFAGATYVNFEETLSRFFTAQLGHCPPVRLVDHHTAHAASAYYASGFSEAMVLTADLSGDRASTKLFHGKGRELQEKRVWWKPNSLGIYYSILTQVLGFRRDSDEYKVMGLSSYGKDEVDLSWLLRPTPDGGYEFATEYIRKLPATEPNPSKQEPFYSQALVERLGPARLPDGPVTRLHENLAASGQALLNRVACHLVTEFHATVGARRLCVAGGVGLNCVMNQHLLALDCVDEIFVQPAASDAGLSLGAAYLAAIEEGERLGPFVSAYLGPEFGNAEIEDTLRMLGARYGKVDDPAVEAARRAAEGRIVGWFQGRMEFGPRALGSRSIVADPRKAEMKDLVNERIKFRESFRPFAPSALAERAGEFFVGCDGNAPYMTITFDVVEKKKREIPAVTHVDGTARVQTVARDVDPLYYALIRRFGEITGTPVVLNTSFNVKGDAIVNTPVQAVSTFAGSGMDDLVIGNFVLSKST